MRAVGSGTTHVTITLRPLWSSSKEASGRTDVSDRPRPSLPTVPSVKSPVLVAAPVTSMTVQERPEFQRDLSSRR